MKSTGVVRKMDHLGRVVLPKELRNTFDIPEGTPMEIFVNNHQIILQKYVPGCVLCGSVEDVQSHKSGKLVCKGCL
ncbi:AbrB/MazE/SpoVT family DNA-binding domain-containing protein [Brevibacillus sp. DP1.3A]|uniref:AbrB/MazE/SpoVT family DNA-binding domain-containing protein n=1 Tax=Brevibacillus sp. DP1.3A TaxID=2738867 RepID=UPI00156AF31F|nr:AbrB/MazE/SpoVT family DNA-binding domain-containing protein [Brevibacillus sp. DP1.3A]UED76075.1 AbrB/MazE/SpoVT family DNA-binding domain-containing protein [Brevibacillus sp. DP1.3A]